MSFSAADTAIKEISNVLREIIVFIALLLYPHLTPLQTLHAKKARLCTFGIWFLVFGT
jgi:uncharacterized integral membrane protein